MSERVSAYSPPKTRSKKPNNSVVDNNNSLSSFINNINSGNNANIRPLMTEREGKIMKNFVGSVILITSFILVGYMIYVQWSFTVLWAILFGGLFSLLLVENYTKKNYPESKIRPSVSLSLISIKLGRFFELMGYYMAKFTDLYYLIKEYVLEDLRNILLPCIDLVTAPFRMIKGWYDYYTQSMTPVTYGLLSGLIIVVGCVFLIGYFNGFHDLYIKISENFGRLVGNFGRFMTNFNL